MEIVVTGKDYKLTDGINSYIQKKLDRIEKYFDDVRATVTLKSQKNEQIAEIQIFSPNAQFRATTADKDLYAAIDKNIDVLEGQIRKYKTKREKLNKEPSIKTIDSEHEFEVIDPENEVLKVSYYEVKPLTIEDAKLKLQENPQNNFLAFLNSADQKVYVIYKLKDGKNYGLIEPEV